MASSYVSSLCKLLLISVIDIAFLTSMLAMFSWYLLPFSILLKSTLILSTILFCGVEPILVFFITSHSSSLYIVGIFSTATIFHGLLHSFSLSVGLCLADIICVRLSACSITNLAPYSDSSIYRFVTNRICCIFGAYAWSFFVISRLYLIKISFQFWWILDLYLFSLRIRMLITLSKTFIWLISCFLTIHFFSRISSSLGLLIVSLFCR